MCFSPCFSTGLKITTSTAKLLKFSSSPLTLSSTPSSCSLECVSRTFVCSYALVIAAVRYYIELCAAIPADVCFSALSPKIYFLPYHLESEKLYDREHSY